MQNSSISIDYLLTRRTGFHQILFRGTNCSIQPI